MPTFYDKLIALGIPQDQAVKALIQSLNDEKQEAQESQGANPEALQEPVVSKRGRPIQDLSMQRVLAHVLLYYSYRKTQEFSITRKQLFAKMKRVFDAYGVIPSYPTDNTLSGILYNLRYGGITGLPTIKTRGPLSRTINGFHESLIHVVPRKASLDMAEGIVLPDWVWPKVDNVS